MSTGSPMLFSSPNLSLAWKDAFDYVMSVSGAKMRPTVVTIAGFDGPVPPEVPTIRNAVDADLQARCRSLSCEQIAFTIFPNGFWNSREPASTLFDFYHKAYSRLIARAKKSNPNWRYGTYFYRMIAPGGDPAHNQLAHIIERWNGTNTNNSMAMQVSCREPAYDLSNHAYPSFPCLQQVGLSWARKDRKVELWLNAFYPLQDMVERAYGNYLGLCRLGHFLAHYMKGCHFAGLNCYVAKPTMGGLTKRALQPLRQQVSTAVTDHADSAVRAPE